MYTEKHLYYSPVPTSLAFEPINLCNAKCFCCPYTEFASDKNFTSQKMSKEQITTLIEDYANELAKHGVKPGKGILLPWRYSDPLVNPNLRLVLELADKHDLKVALTTNAISFGKRQCDALQEFKHVIGSKIWISVIGFTEEEVKEQMQLSKARQLKSLEFVKKYYPDLSRKQEIAIKNRDQGAPVPGKTIEEYQSRTLGRAKPKRNWISNRLGKGDDNWTPVSKWKPSEQSFVNGCGMSAGKIMNRLEIMVNGRAALCCDMSFDENFPKSKVDYGNVFEIGIAGVWKNLTEEHKLIYKQKWDERKQKLICNDCNRSGINSFGWSIDKTVEKQRTYKKIFGFTT